MQVNTANTLKIISLIKSKCPQTQVYPISEITPQHIATSDIIVGLGGDGTFLKLISLITSPMKCLCINTNPNQSIGHISAISCMNIDQSLEMIEQILMGSYKETKFSRIRCCIEGNTYYALNEVFVGESLMGKISTLQLDGHNELVKCFGLIASTGCGSSSWFQSINTIYPSNICTLNGDIKNICDEHNKQILFSPSSNYMKYTVIHPNKIWVDKNKVDSKWLSGQKSAMSIVSLSRDGIVVLDGVTTIKVRTGSRIELKCSDSNGIIMILNR